MPSPDRIASHSCRRLLAVQEAAVAKLAYVAEQPAAAAVLCGPPGSGKSLVVEALKQTLEAAGLSCRIVLWQALREAPLCDGADVLLVDAVDDAAEGELATAMSRCWAGNPALRIILVGSGRLLTLVSRDTRLERRLGLRAVLTPCSRGETRRLVADALAPGHDDADESAVTRAVADTIHEITGGIPGDIARLAGLAAVVAADRSAAPLTPAVIERVHGRLAVTAA
jgi:type II secretory pathway predicted ATPase ExeA